MTMVYINRGFIRKTVLFSLIFLTILCEFVVSGETLTEDAKVLQNFGKDIMKLPNAPKSGSTLEKAKYAYEMYCNGLAGNHIGVDSNLFTRLQSLFSKNSERADFYCGNHVKNLQDILKGAGLYEGVALVADKESYNYWDPNRNHAGLIVFDDDGKPYVFDAWMQAVTQKAESMQLQDADKAVDQMLKDNVLTRKTLYSNAKNSEFNGMNLAAWVNLCKTRGYKVFKVDDVETMGGSDIETISKNLNLYIKVKKSNTPPVNDPNTPVSGNQKDCLLCGGSKDCYFALKPYSAGNEPWKETGCTEAYARVYREGDTIMAEFHNYPYIDPCGDPNKIKVFPFAGPFAVLTDEQVKRVKENLAKGYTNVLSLSWAPKATCDGIVYDGFKEDYTAIRHSSSGGDFTIACNKDPVKNTKLWELWFRYSTPTS